MPFEFDNKISLGHILTIASLVIGGVAGFVSVVVAFSLLGARVDAIAANDLKQDRKLETLTDTVSEIRTTLTEQGVDIRYIRSFVEDERRAARTAANTP